MEAVIHLWFLWFIAMLGFGVYAVLNHVERIASILSLLEMKLSDIAPLFFNGRKFTWFVITAVVTFGFFILFSVSLFLNIVRATRVNVKLF